MPLTSSFWLGVVQSVVERRYRADRIAFRILDNGEVVSVDAGRQHPLIAAGAHGPSDDRAQLIDQKVETVATAHPTLPETDF
jgi:hypothetical protein